MISPHGGKLIERVLSSDRAKEYLERKDKLPQIEVEEATLKDIFNICCGVFSPLEGFLGSKDYKQVLDSMRLADDTPWTIPIVLDVSEEASSKLKEGDEVLLVDSEKNPIAVLHLKEKYRYDRQEFARKVFATLDDKHPGVTKVKSMNPILLGGEIDLIQEPQLPFMNYTLKPIETRVLFKEKGWNDIVGFQTRNVPHLGHEYVQKTALAFTDGIFINPVIGKKKKGDFTDEVILDSYNALIKHYYLQERAVMSVLQLEMRYAGPREAILHAIVRKNFGCTHFIVGRDHAGVGNYYHPFAAHEIFSKFPDLVISPIFFSSFFHCKKCGGVCNEKTCPHSEEERINFSGTKMRELLEKGEMPSKEMMREEVVREILRHKELFVK